MYQMTAKIALIILIGIAIVSSYASGCNDGYSQCEDIRLGNKCDLDASKRLCRKTCGHCKEPVLPAPVPTSTCFDTIDTCDLVFGQCASPTSLFIPFCRLTCGACGCIDTGSNCEHYVANGLCQKQLYVRNCAKTCGLCVDVGVLQPSPPATSPPQITPPPAPTVPIVLPNNGCVDEYATCDEILSGNKCDLEASKRLCRKTCQHCGEPVPPAPTPTLICFDAIHTCDHVFRHCASPTSSLLPLCRLTCEKCECIDTGSNCEHYVANGLCQNQLYVRNCIKTCGLCVAIPTPTLAPTPAPTLAPTPAPVCKDRILDCDDVNDKGLCHTTLGSSCKKTCGKCQYCVDEDECSTLAGEGFCLQSAKFKADCPKSCGACV